MIFRSLSIFSASRALRLLKKAAGAGDCLLCGVRVDAARVCAPCRLGVPRPDASCPPAFEAACAALAYRFPVDRAVQRFKFAGDFAAGRWLADELAAAARSAPRPDVLVVPALTRARLRERGFNQALELARAVGRTLDIRVDARAVVKSFDTDAQAGLGRERRLANLRGAFRIEGSFAGRHVAIVDDVMTTGATAEAIGSALRAAGAARVSVWVAARTPEPGR